MSTRTGRTRRIDKGLREVAQSPLHCEIAFLYGSSESNAKLVLDKCLLHGRTLATPLFCLITEILHSKVAGDHHTPKLAKMYISKSQCKHILWLSRTSFTVDSLYSCSQS